MRHIKQNKFGLAENPINQHVTMQWHGKTLLGEIYGIEHGFNNLYLKVKYFCGDDWPVNPVPSAVMILE